jgi:hypothetical protein
MREDDAAYFSRRALQEQFAAQKATCEAARHLHDELATMYRFRAAMLTKHPTCWGDALKQQTELA